MPTLRRAPVMAAVLVAVIAAFSLVNVRPTSASTAGDAIASRALQDLGTYGGQCYTWMQKIVKEAIGVQVGNDYRYGYLDTGFVEVTASQAQRGDIIQIDNDADTSPYSNFPGLHTFIILQNLGNGTFNGIDSNQDWDGIVRLHNDFNPAAAAARYAGGTYHIYHYAGAYGGSTASTASTTTTSSAGPTPAAPSFKSGDTAVTNTPPPDPYLDLHNAASLAAGLVSVLPNSTKLSITGGPVYADGYWWVPVTSPDGTGWVAAEYLVNTTPAPPPAPAATTTSASSSSGASGSYTVAAGDTLYGIAAKFGVSVSALESANNITNPDVITAGTTLAIPSGNASSSATTSSGSTYTVRAGDTLYSIAAQFGVSVSALESANNLADPNLITVGLQLTIPAGTATTTAAAVAAPVASASTYTVQPGDTLWGIAGRFGVAVSSLQALNSISDGNLIVVGDVLKIPGSGSSSQADNVQTQSAAGSSTYTVTAGDTLYSIASHFGVDLTSLESVNSLANPGLIIVGQALTIP